jgi:hypothetical protein
VAFWLAYDACKPPLVLSSPAFVVSATPKIQWCEKHLNVTQKSVILGSDKAALAKRGRVLVDDRLSVCCEFIKAGGHAILVACPHSFDEEVKWVGACSISGLTITNLKNLPITVKGMLDRGLLI